jgi:CRP/FNR family transcriptional regulator
MTPESIHPETQFLRETFHAFNQSDLVEWLVQQSLQKDFEPDTELMRVGSTVRHIPLVLQGSVKVSREDAEGREIFLYYILPGETCAMPAE